eukprot:421875_1
MVNVWVASSCQQFIVDMEVLRNNNKIVEEYDKADKCFHHVVYTRRSMKCIAPSSPQISASDITTDTPAQVMKKIHTQRRRRIKNRSNSTSQSSFSMMKSSTKTAYDTYSKGKTQKTECT